ncbi:MAG: hypothetical protein ACI8UO_005119 [Verrucomicrobiales bacterium]|jgi:hypothetical protein
MSITHQTLLDEEGKPAAALIPWDVFKEIRKRLGDDNEDDEKLSPEWREELDRRLQSIKDGSAKTIPHEQVMAEVREQMRNPPASGQSA